MPRIRRFTERLSFYVLPTTKAWFEKKSVETRRPASEIYREALEKYQQFHDALEEKAKREAKNLEETRRRGSE